MDVCKSLNISIVTVMKNPEMLKFVPDHCKTRKMCKHAVRKITLSIEICSWYQYKTQQMCDKAILENVGTLKSVPYCYKNQEMCNKAVKNYPHAWEFVSECYKTQKMHDKAVNTYPSTIKFVPECFMTQTCVTKQLIDGFFIWFYSWSI